MSVLPPSIEDPSNLTGKLKVGLIVIVLLTP
jgi:hypothetical protein